MIEKYKTITSDFIFINLSRLNITIRTRGGKLCTATINFNGSRIFFFKRSNMFSGVAIHLFGKKLSF